MIVARAADPVETVALALLEPTEVVSLEVTKNWKAKLARNNFYWWVGGGVN